MVRELAIAFGIVAVCVVIHICGMVLLAERMLNYRGNPEEQPELKRIGLLLIVVFGGITLLHIAETGIWAAFYYWKGLFENYETSLYFSLGSYTTIGYGDIVLPRNWRLLGAIEGISGVLLCGISTAFIFAIVNGFFQIRIQRRFNRR